LIVLVGPRPARSPELADFNRLGRDQLLTNKRATGRKKDLADLEALGEGT
jgi:hypothetical protein